MGGIHKQWFSNNLVRKICIGGNTLFWYGMWLENGPLHSRFSRLFGVVRDKFIIVANMIRLGGSWER